MSGRATRPTPLVLAGVVAIVGAATLIGVPLTGLVAGPSTVIVAALASVTAGVLATVGVVADERRRPPRSWTARVVVYAAGWFVGTAVVALVATTIWRGPPSTRRSPIEAILDAVVNGWATVATSPVPADTGPTVLVPLVLVVSTATWAGVVVFLRTDAPLAPVLPAVAGIVTTSLAAGGRAGAPVLVGVGLALATGVVLLARGGRRATVRSANGRRVVRRATVGVTAGVLVLATAAGAVLGPQLTFGRSDDPFDPRDLTDPASLTTATVNPIELVASWLQRPDTILFTTRTSEPITTRLVALDTFDGVRWTSGATYRSTGTVLPMVDRTAPSRPLTFTVEVAGLDGPWLPTVADMVSVTGTRVLVDEFGQTIVTGDNRRVPPYTVDADVPALDDPAVQQRLATLPVAHDESTVNASAALTEPPEWVRELATAAVGPSGAASAPYMQAVRLEEYLWSNFDLADIAAPGHSYGHLARSLLRGERGAASEEQFAAAFAVVGRALGLPTRVVVGFGPGTEVEPDVYEVGTDDVRVWPEVRFAEVGWVPFAPTPGAETTRSDTVGDEDGFGVGLDPDAMPPPFDDANTPDPATPEPDEPEPDRSDPDDRAGTDPAFGAVPLSEPAPGRSATSWLLIGVAAAAVLAVPLLAIVAAKRRQTARRRRRGTASARVLGAWRDVRDRLSETGDGRDRDLDRHTLDELIAGDDGGPLTGLYRPVNQALYGMGTVTDDDADQAWKARDRFVETRRRSSNPRRRLRHAVDPRPLLPSVVRVRRGSSPR